MDSLYTFPLISQDLRREEYVLQIADSLEYLTNVVDDIFLRINRRIEENSSKTQHITDRISICKSKVDKLTNSNKATNIYSGAKYPAMDCFKYYETVFAHNKNEVALKRSENEIISKAVKPEENQIQEKLEFYHVKSSSSNLFQWLSENQPHSGLGEIPSGIENISSLLIFNTKQYAYGLESIKKGKHSQNNKTGIAIPERKYETNNVIEAAPFSISNRDKALKKAPDSYLYSPGTKEAPAMDMPLDLPYLSGVAEDLYLSLETEPVIAPSVNIASNNDVVIEPPTQPIPPEIVSLENESETVIADKSDKAEEIVVSNSSTPVPVPPPPPPPPLVLMDLTDAPSDTSTSLKKGKKTNVKPAPSVSIPDDRSNLMAAIRNAGGSGKAKLRSVQNTKTEEVISNKNGGDLMADLHAKLSMRRKGISGDKPRAADGSILSVISAMIPPPVQKPADQSSNAEVSSTDEDWE